ncbi:MAG: hypothetical protein KDD66_06465 [Bdellovibrionales bacterium]|nr:hypothetical protein [Bdellovibrionales bacterium]
MEDTKPKIPERLVPLLAALRSAQPDESTDVVTGRKQNKTGTTIVEVHLDGNRIVMAVSIVKTLDGASLFALYGKLASGVMQELDVPDQFGAFENALSHPTGSFTYELAAMRDGSSGEVSFEECSISAQGSGENHTVRIRARVRASFDALETLAWLQELESFVGSVDLGDKRTVRSDFIAALGTVEAIVFVDDEEDAAADPLGVDSDADEGDGVVENLEESPPVHPIQPAADPAAEEDSAPAPAASAPKPKPTISAALQRMIDEMDLKTEAIPAGDLLDEAMTLQAADVPIMKHPAEGAPYEVTVDRALGRVRKKLGPLPTVTRSVSRSEQIRSRGRRGKKGKKGDE